MPSLTTSEISSRTDLTVPSSAGRIIKAMDVVSTSSGNVSDVEGGPPKGWLITGSYSSIDHTLKEIPAPLLIFKVDQAPITRRL
jgi:hypothetical protein